MISPRIYLKPNPANGFMLILFFFLSHIGVSVANPTPKKAIRHFLRIENVNAFKSVEVMVVYPKSVISSADEELVIDANGRVSKKRPTVLEIIEQGLVYRAGTYMMRQKSSRLTEDSLAAQWWSYQEASGSEIEESDLFFSRFNEFRFPEVQPPLMDSLDEAHNAFAISDVYRITAVYESSFVLELVSRHYETEGGKIREASADECRAVNRSLQEAAKRRLKRPSQSVFSDPNGKKVNAVRRQNQVVFEPIDEKDDRGLWFLAVVVPIILVLLVGYVMFARRRWIEHKRGQNLN